MTTLLVIAWASACILLLLHSSVRLTRAPHSHFELKRRHDDDSLRRERLFYDVTQLRTVVATALLIIAVGLSIIIWQGLGAIMTFAVFVIIQPVARFQFVGRMGHALYDPQEPKILAFLDKSSIVAWFIGSNRTVPSDQKVESVEQLQHLVETSGTVLTDDQQTIIKQGLKWHNATVESIMTPVRDIVSIKHTELLGPLVLDDLHRSGYTRFPVVRGSIDNVIGILNISQLLDVTAGKRSETVEKTMSLQALRIESDEPLPNALHMLEKSHQHMLIAIDHEGKTVGLVTLRDITSSLLGKNRGEMV